MARQIVCAKCHENWFRFDWGIREIHSPWLINLMWIWLKSFCRINGYLEIPINRSLWYERVYLPLVVADTPFNIQGNEICWYLLRDNDTRITISIKSIFIKYLIVNMKKKIQTIIVIFAFNNILSHQSIGYCFWTKFMIKRYSNF